MGILFNYILEWDCINHRIYLGWAYLNNRLMTDILPVTFRTCHCPFIDAANFFIMNKLSGHPFIFLFVSGLKYGFFIFISVMIFNLILEKRNILKNFLLVSAAVLGATSFFVLLTKGYSHTDMQPAIILLIALYLFFISAFEDKNLKNSLILFASSFLIGIAVLLKYNHGVFGLSLIISTLFFYKSVKQPVKTLLIMLSGMISGFFLFGGHWFYVLYSHFHNPFYPYFHNLFPSPISDSTDIFFIDFAYVRPNNLLKFIFAPFKNPLLEPSGIEDGYCDLRIAIGFFSVFIYLCLRNKFLPEICKVVKPLFVDFSICMIFLCFYINLYIFSNYRYIIYLFPLLAFISVIVCYLIVSLLKFNKFPLVFFIFCISLMILSGFYIYLDFYNTKIFNCILAGLFLSYCIYKFIRDKEGLHRNVYSLISLLVVPCILITYYCYSDLKFEPPFNKKTIYVENVGIEDNANVILGMVKTSFIVPYQNPKARYIGFAIPQDYEKDGKFYSLNEYFKNVYLENQLLKIFKEDRPLYFVYAENLFGFSLNRKIFERSIQYYSDNQISEINNCVPVENQIIFNDLFNEVFICKLK